VSALACGIVRLDLEQFSYGEPGQIDDHVVDCEICLGMLADLWVEEPPSDLAEPVVRALRLEEFLLESGMMAGAVLADMVRALLSYALKVDDEEDA